MCGLVDDKATHLKGGLLHIAFRFFLVSANRSFCFLSLSLLQGLSSDVRQFNT